MEKREKKRVAGHESDKLIESYNAQPAAVRVIFDYQTTNKFNQSNSGQFNLFLQMGLIISSTFSFFDFLIFRPQQQIQVLPTSHYCNT